MKFFYSKNLTEKTMHCDIAPWDFKPTEALTVQIREDKQTRQDWYRTVTTSHYFYTGIEGANPNQRPSKDNPPRNFYAFHADFDLRIPPERVAEAIKAMKIKPAWVERSLGGNVRLVWVFTRPLAVDSFDFACYILSKAVKWLNLDLLPGLDAAAFEDPSRLLCNGCAWHETGFGPIPENELQAFFVKCGKDFRFRASAENNIPLNEIEKEIRSKYPNFNWPCDFTVNSQGPTFWVPDSTTPLSAVLKEDGMFTFSAHASKPFYPWSDIVGSDFVKQFATNTIARATSEIYWDGKRFWRKISGIYSSCDMAELSNFFKVECKLSSKPGNDGVSPVETALNHIYNEGRIYGAAPHLFRPMGVMEFNGRRVLNTYLHKVMKPADELTPWGENGKFAWVSRHLDNFFDPHEQLKFFLAWLKAYYESGLTLTPMPGQNIFFMGGVNVGKTMTSRAIIGKIMGGFADASAYLIQGGGFNSELIEAPLWCSDDETMGESTATQNNFQAMMKKTAANQTLQFNKKFEVGCTTEWMGRIICTTNLDYVSSRSLGPMDNSSLDKVSIFRCANRSNSEFPNRHVLNAILEKELPYFLRWLMSWNPPEEVKRDVRFVYAAYHEQTLLDQAHQSNKVAPFKELLYEILHDYFVHNPEATEWRGTLTQLVRFLSENPLNDTVLRNLRLEQTSRYLEVIQRENLIECHVDTGPVKTRVWIFPRFKSITKPEQTEAVMPPMVGDSKYTKK